MNTESIISNLLDKAYDSTVSYAELGSSANDLTVQMLKEIEKGLNKQGVSLRLPDEPKMRIALGLPEKGKPLKEEKLTKEQYNLFNRCYLAAYQLAKTEDEKTEICNLIIEQNEKLIIELAKKYKDCSYYYDDILNNGRIGLGEAVKHYDFDMKVPLGSYAPNWIKKKIDETLKDQISSFSLEKSVKEALPKFKKILQEIEDEGRKPSYEEFSRRMKIKKDVYDDCLSHIKAQIMELESCCCVVDEDENQQELDENDVFEFYFKFCLTRPKKPGAGILSCFVFLAHTGLLLRDRRKIMRIFEDAVLDVGLPMSGSYKESKELLSKFLSDKDLIFGRIIEALSYRNRFIPLNEVTAVVSFDETELLNIHDALSNDSPIFEDLLFSLDFDNQILLVKSITYLYPDDIYKIAKKLGVMAYSEDEYDNGLPNAKNKITFDELERFLHIPKKKLEVIYKEECKKFKPFAKAMGRKKK